MTDDRGCTERPEEYYEWIADFFAVLDESGYWESFDFEAD